MTRPPAGARVELVVDVDRYPHFVAPAGATGVVVDLDDPQIILAVRLDEPLVGAEEWSNEVHWFDGDGDDMDVDEYLALYVRELEPAPAEADFVNVEALRAADTGELVEIIIGGGPTALIEATVGELKKRDELDMLEGALDVRDEQDEQERAYAIASADVVLPLTTAEATTIADALEYLAGVDEGENTPYAELVRLAGVVRAALEARS